MTYFGVFGYLPLWQVASFGALLGAIHGSFLGAVLLRAPQGRSIVHQGSACDSCSRRLSAFELVPVLSFLVLRGRCRTCGARIDPWHFVCEVGGAIIGALPWLVGDNPVHAVGAMLMGWELLLLGLLDLRHLWLPRRFVGALAGTALAMMLFRSWEMGWSAEPVVVGLIGGGLGFALLASVRFVYRRSRGREGMGAGDPPLLGAIGLWVGSLGVIEVLLGASILGILAAIVLHLTGRKVESDTALPLGTCLAAAAWPLFLLQGFG